VAGGAHAGGRRGIVLAVERAIKKQTIKNRA
jgi:hypothetical protein